jgi:serine/threonine protein kinase/tetratricopeptide (TPR) repeat protein
MTPERWEIVSDLFEAALQREPLERNAFLVQMCVGDDELRAEVESLIHEHENGGELLVHSPIDASALLRDAWQQAGYPSAPDPHIGTTVANRYRIDTRLARGGQAVVYLARDLMLRSKPVVVKILAASEQNGWLGSRLQHEIEALARIDHPGVVGVLDTGSLPDGSPFLVMQYAEGSTLRQALKRGALERSRAATILRQIGAALEAAHGKGIVHGDLKPENIVLQRLDDGSELVKLIDFGLARVERAEAVSRTTAGPIAGSVRYMAPEQFQGETSRASDMYVLGLLACEMLCGHPDLRVLRARRNVTRLIRAALAFQPHERPSSAKAWCERLASAVLHPWRRSIEHAAAVAAVAAVLIAWAPWTRGPAAPQDGPIEIRELAILPFHMLGPSAEHGALEVGVADALITRLSNIAGLVVRPVATVRRYHAANVDPVLAARTLNVDAIVEGTLQSSESGIRASVRLIHAHDGRALWAGTVDANGGRLFTLEDSLAEQIALHVNARLTESERRRLEARRRLDPHAHELYVKGRFEWGKRTRDGLENAADYFRRAIDLDPTYAHAHVGLADSYLLLGGFGHYPPAEMLPKAAALASRALELDPSLGEAHTTLAFVSQHLDWDWPRVEDHYRKAIALSPNYATGHHWYAELLSILGRFDQSRREFAEARRIDPISPMIQVDEAQLSYFERQYDRSLEILRRVAQQNPGVDVVHNRIALALLAQGRDEEAWTAVQRFADCHEETSDCRRVWTALLPRRDSAAARRALRWMEAEASSRLIAPTTLAHAYVRQGDYDRAVDWLERHLDWHDAWMITVKVSPMFEPLRRHPRFERLLRKLNLAD